MKTPVELYFSNGQNTKVVQTLLLEPGEVQRLINADMSSFGAVKVANSFLSAHSFAGTVVSILDESSGKRYVCEGNNIWEDNAGTLTLVSAALDGSTVSGVDYAGWMYLATDDGTQKKFLITDRSLWYPWGVPNPTVAPTTGGASTDAYQTYYSWVAKYSDGSEYETDLSPAGYTPHTATATGTATGGSATTLVDSTATFTTNIVGGMKCIITSVADGSENIGYVKTVAATTIVFDAALTNGYTCVTGDTFSFSGTTAWTVIPTTSNAEVTHKRLYRAIGGDIKYVTELAKATSSYTDTMNDEDLIGSNTFARTGYYQPPSNMWMVLEHYRRIFAAVDGAYSNCIFWSEEEEPQAFTYDVDTSLYANFTDVFRKGEAVTGLASFGGDLFIASKRMWKRLVGSYPSYWSLRPTLSSVGNLARYALVTTRYGLLHIWYDGIYLFNGFNSNRLTGKNEPFFQDVNWTYASEIRSTFDGKVARFFVPYGTSTTTNRCFVLDMESYPRVKCYEEDQGESMAMFDCNTNETLYAKGVQYGERTGSGVIAFDLWTKTIPTASLIQLDGASQLNYEIDTNGEDVTLTVYHDNVAHGSTITLNTLTRTRGWCSLPIKNSRTMSLRITGNLTSNVVLYEPWIVGGNQ